MKGECSYRATHPGTGATTQDMSNFHQFPRSGCPWTQLCWENLPEQDGCSSTESYKDSSDMHRQDLTRRDKMWQDLTRHDKTRQDATRFDRMWHDVTSFDKTRQDLARRDEMWQNATRCDKTRLTRQDVTKCHQMRQDATRYDQIWPDMTRCNKTWQDVTRCDKVHANSGKVCQAEKLLLQYAMRCKLLSLPEKSCRFDMLLLESQPDQLVQHRRIFRYDS